MGIKKYIYLIYSIIALFKTFKQGILWLILLTLLFAYSCKDNRNRGEIAKIVTEWIGKEIRFAENIPCYMSGKETFSEICDEWFQKDYKILMYVDSAGCSDCRLRLFEWEQLMTEADTLFNGRVGFLLYFQPKSIREMSLLFTKELFDFPVFMDINGDMNRLNRFPRAMEYQCFLLDSDNKVVMVGNPVLNMRIWELYKLQIADGNVFDRQSSTSVFVDKTIHEYGDIHVGSSNIAEFTITNTGNYPLVIHRVSSSCGCTGVEWEKRPIAPGQTGTVRVEMNPDEIGFFSNTINVHCSINESPIRLTVNGTATELNVYQ